MRSHVFIRLHDGNSVGHTKNTVIPVKYWKEVRVGVFEHLHAFFEGGSRMSNRVIVTNHF